MRSQPLISPLRCSPPSCIRTTIARTPCSRRARAASLAASASGRKVRPRMLAGTMTVGAACSISPMKPTRTPPTSRIAYAGSSSRGVVPSTPANFTNCRIGFLRVERDIGREIRERRSGKRSAILAAVYRMAAALLNPVQLPPPFVEVMIAERRQLQSRKAQRLDRRLVVKETRQKRRPADVVARRDDHGVGIGCFQPREVCREVLDATGIR